MARDYTLEESAELTGISADVLRVYIHRGKLKAHKRGRQWFIRHRDLPTPRIASQAKSLTDIM